MQTQDGDLVNIQKHRDIYYNNPLDKKLKWNKILRHGKISLFGLGILCRKASWENFLHKTTSFGTAKTLVTIFFSLHFFHFIYNSLLLYVKCSITSSHWCHFLKKYMCVLCVWLIVCLWVLCGFGNGIYRTEKSGTQSCKGGTFFMCTVCGFFYFLNC